MYVKSIAVTDYSTGTQYTYSGTDGTWQSIKSTGGTIGSSGGGSKVDSNAPAVTLVSNGAPVPFEGTHRDTASTAVHSGYPWVASTLVTSPSSTATTYPGLPAGWTVTSSGKVLPPSNAASVSEPPLFRLFPYYYHPLRRTVFAHGIVNEQAMLTLNSVSVSGYLYIAALATAGCSRWWI